MIAAQRMIWGLPTSTLILSSPYVSKLETDSRKVISRHTSSLQLSRRECHLRESRRSSGSFGSIHEGRQPVHVLKSDGSLMTAHELRIQLPQASLGVGPAMCDEHRLLKAKVPLAADCKSPVTLQTNS